MTHTMNTTAQSNARHFWAFAVDVSRPRHIRRRKLGSPRKYLDRYQITALSPRLKALGVRAGMSYQEAKKIMPEMRILICNR